MSNNSSDTTLFTYDRLNNFVKNYKEYVNELITTAKGPDGDRYKYYHFEYSPNGIIMANIGQIPSMALTSFTNWFASPTMNTPNSWKMNISKTYNTMKHQNQTIVNGLPKQNGLQFKIINLPNNSYSLNYGTFQLNSNSFINEFQSPSQNTSVISQGITTNFDNYANAFNDPSGVLFLNAFTAGTTSIGCEWFGYFKPDTIGNYMFTVNASDGYFYVWIGDKAICEYTTKNLDIYNGEGISTINIPDNTYYPIRIQYYAQTTAQNVANSIPQFSMNIKQINIDGTQSNIPTEKCMHVIRNSDINGSTYFPPLKYLAFVSPSIADYHLGQFKCYQLDLTASSDKILEFYQFLNKYKFGMQTQKYDMVDNVLGFGQLPDNTIYTPVNGDVNSLPDLFSIYRLNTDLRMGNSMQIDSQISKDNLYSMRAINPDLLQYANSYNTLSQYYPAQIPNDTTNYQPATNLDGSTCKLNCDKNPNCKHYFTYTSNNEPKCIIDTVNSIPEFNQIRPTSKINPIDEGSSTLFLRNTQFVTPSCGELSGGGTDLIQTFKTVTNTDVYNSSFPYANYEWSTNSPLNDIKNIGVCGDAKYKKMTNDAAEILYNKAEYNKNGTFTLDQGQNGVVKPEGFQNVPSPSFKQTNVIDDTSDSIRASLQNQQTYAHMMEKINKNYIELSQKDIPDYLNTRKILNDNVNYDFKGDVLLHYRTKPIPSTRQQNILDTREEGGTQNQLYILGTLSAAVLLVLAIIIGRE